MLLKKIITKINAVVKLREMYVCVKEKKMSKNLYSALFKYNPSRSFWTTVAVLE